ncbi:tryptophan synthase subunit alpha [Thermithiobacillus tepidarius DSM 3134]|uniref:tryptophan synthase subunit alpha n=1 Tax=Thermithiobacillus tepidarius TaxID=929 RepID=UPI0004220725|nr:tryptophan synthase subunit alpha [Thermithiobacillus tepidarius]
MSRLKHTFDRLRASRRAAMIPFFTAGDPEPGVTVPMLQALAAAGADIIEVGVPFSDPMADGPTIQQANERALRHHVNLRQVLGAVAAFRQGDQDTPVVLMGYLNPVEVMGYAAFAEAAAQAGVDGVITVDLPPEEADDLVRELRQRDIDPIFLLAPTSSEERIQLVAQQASGFVYYVSMRGVTGAGGLDTAAVAAKLEAVRRQTTLPVGVGFGIQDAETAAAVARMADAVVVGSAVVKEIAAARDANDAVRRASALVKGLAAAVHGAREPLQESV